MTIQWLTVLSAILLTLLLTACAAPESVIPYESVPPNGDPVRGEALFGETIRGVAACNSCHVEDAAGAPNLDDYAAIAGERVAEQDAREYTFYAITEPAQYIVEGYGNAMPNLYDDRLAAQDIADLMAYLLAE